MSFNFGNTSAIGTSTPAKRKYIEINFPPSYQCFWLCLIYVYGQIDNPSAAFGNFSFNTTAPPAFGAPVATPAAGFGATQTPGFGATPGFGQTSFGASG